MNPLKRLAGQTAIYGVSSIVGRLLNYFLVPLHTRYFIASDYGITNEMYAYVTFLLVILTYGMETAFFRFLNLTENKNKLYSTCLISILCTTFVFILFVLFFHNPISILLRYPNNSEYIVWFAVIVSLDAISAIPFVRIRAQNNPKRFAIIKLFNILVNIFFNIFFIVICPLLAKTDNTLIKIILEYIYNPKIGVGYIFISNLIASIATIILLFPEFIKIKYEFDKELWKKIIVYALPLLVVGIAGTINETMDRILIKYLLPSDISMQQLGIYGACYKISILMTIFIQAFRFAAEPFFFSYAKEKDSKHLYGQIMNYFVIVCLFIFLSVTLYIDIVKYFIGPNFYEGLKVVPILLLANMFLGIYFNLSIWYKLTGQTTFGAYLSIFGAVITLLLNFWWIPIFGYIGSAWATMICYLTMMVASYIFGQKYYKVNYNLKKVFSYLGLALVIFTISKYFLPTNYILKFIFNTMLMLFFVGCILYFEYYVNILKVKKI